MTASEPTPVDTDSREYHELEDDLTEQVHAILSELLPHPGRDQAVTVAEFSRRIVRQLEVVDALIANDKFRADHDRLRATPEPPLRFANECHEEVTRRGEWEPCDLPAVALRIDEGEPYPVCGPRSEKIGGYSGGKTVRAAGSTPTPKETDD
jgi:hypothetical protein